MSTFIIDEKSFIPENGSELKNIIVSAQDIPIYIFCDSDDSTISYTLKTSDKNTHIPLESICEHETVKIFIQNTNKENNNIQVNLSKFFRRNFSNDNDSLEVHVPPHSNLNILNQVGKIIITGPAGITKAKTGTGRISIETAHFAEANTGAGNITIDECQGGNLASGVGSITATVLAGKCSASTGTGKIMIRLPRNTPIWHKVSSGLGKCQINLEPHGKPAPGEPFIEIHCGSGTGKICLEHIE